MEAHVGMLGVNAQKALKLQDRLIRQGFEYRFPTSFPTSAMVRHGFVKRLSDGTNEWRTLNERSNGFHNITEVS